jgi:hypothetical protein
LEPWANHPVQTGFLPHLRRAPDHQTRPAQELFPAFADLFVQRLLKITKNYCRTSEDLRQHGSSVKRRQTSGCSKGCRCVIRHSDSSILDYFPGVTCARPIRP